MPKLEDNKVLPYSAQQMFDMVSDVGRYPDFLPWVVGARLFNEHNDDSGAGFDADLIVGIKMFKERFTSRVTLNNPEHCGEKGEKLAVHVEYIKGPMKYLHNYWTFEDIEGGCQVNFLVDFEFKNIIFQKLAGALFEDAVFKMMSAFEERAKVLY